MKLTKFHIYLQSYETDTIYLLKYTCKEMILRYEHFFDIIFLLYVALIYMYIF